MTVGDVETQPGLVEHKSRKEQVADWLERGLDGNAVCSYGTSVEELMRILQSGELTSSPIDPNIPYQARITNEGQKCLYFFTPFLARVNEVNPTLAAKIQGEFDNSQQAKLNLDIPRSVGISKRYAEIKAVADFLPELRLIADRTVPVEELQQANDEGGNFETIIDQLMDDSPEDRRVEVADLREKLMDPSVSKKIKEALKRKGVLIYFNSGIFNNSIAFAGSEDPQEIMVTSDTPLGLGVISGIEIGTIPEKEEVLASL